VATNRDPGEQGLVELLRDYRERLERLETRKTITVGSYRIEQNAGGQLVAVHLLTNATVILLNPEDEIPEP
jgi:hypothetical protein